MNPRVAGWHHRTEHMQSQEADDGWPDGIIVLNGLYAGLVRVRRRWDEWIGMDASMKAG